MALCAICNNTNATVHICRTCRADPANVDWSQRMEKCSFSDALHPGLAYELMGETKIKHNTPLARAIARATVETRIVTVYIDKLGRRRGTAVRKSPTIAEIAAIADASRGWVGAVLARFRK